MKTIALALLLLALSLTARADKKRGLYVGAGIGQFNVEAEDIDDLAPILEDFDSDATAFKVFGGWRFNPYLAVEIDYIDFGAADDEIAGQRIEAKINGVAPYLVGNIPLGPVDLFAKVGYLFYDIDSEVAGREVTSSSGDQDDIIYGVGAGLTFFKHIQARLEYEMLDVSEPLDDADVLWLSAAWRF